jgi:hypothetical protein
MRRDFQFALVLGLAALPAGMAVSEAIEYFPYLKGHPGVGFWGSFAITVVLLVFALGIAIRGEHKAEQEGAKRRLIPQLSRESTPSIVALIVFLSLIISITSVYQYNKFHGYYNQPPYPSEASAPSPTFPDAPIASTAFRYIFRCPLDNGERSKELMTLEQVAKAMEAGTGLSVHVTIVDKDSEKLEISPKEGSFVSFPSMANKIDIEAHHIDDYIIAIYTTDLSGGGILGTIFSHFPIPKDKTYEPIISQYKSIVERLFRVEDGKCTLL